MKQARVRKRAADFSARTVTRIWQEQPSAENPYLARSCRCQGYDLLELAGKRSFPDVLFLLFCGELPEPEQAKLLEALMILLINPGPRHPATRAAMNAGVSRANPAHILPVSLAVLGGDYLGGGEVTAAMRFFCKHQGIQPGQMAEKLLKQSTPPAQGDWHLAPGFGSRFNGIDPMPRDMVAMLLELPGAGAALRWGQGLVEALLSHGIGWLHTGAAAAVFCDLGLPPRAGAGLFQFLSAPGLLAHGLEMADKPITAMPFLDEEHYVVAPEARTGKK